MKLQEIEEIPWEFIYCLELNNITFSQLQGELKQNGEINIMYIIKKLHASVSNTSISMWMYINTW